MKKRLFILWQSGVTLVEVLISLVILAIVLLASTSLMQIIQDQNWFNYHFSVASLLSQARIEELRNIAFTSSAFTVTTDWTPTTAQRLTSTGQADAKGYYYRQWTITRPAIIAPMKRITVRTQWIDYKNKTHQVELSSDRAP